MGRGGDWEGLVGSVCGNVCSRKSVQQGARRDPCRIISGVRRVGVLSPSSTHSKKPGGLVHDGWTWRYC